MNRRFPTKGTADWFQRYVQAFSNQVKSNVPPDKQKQVYEQAKIIEAALSTIYRLESAGRIDDVPEPKTLKVDETAHLSFDQNWQPLAAEVFADGFARYGVETVSSVAEVACHSHALATAFGADKIFYRGEHHYGNPLRSRAERHLPDGAGKEKGLTDKELSELRRFQCDVRRDRALAREIRNRSLFLPRRNDPIWLPIMQHYDEQFGTRLLDLTASMYAGLYFACVNWDGEIDDTMDGILYAFYRGRSGGGMITRGTYYDRTSDEFDEEWDDMAPMRVQDSFLDWKYPEYLRIYKSSVANPREAAQDGLFLFRGALGEPPQFGQGFKWRVPAVAKIDVARQLWMAGYTPERIVRGEKGRVAHKLLRIKLGLKY